MLVRPACYKKLKQKTFENNSNRFRTILDPFICVFRFLSGTIMKSDTKLTVVMCCHLFDQRHAAPSSGNFRRRPSPPKACGLSWRNGFLLALQRGLKYTFNNKSKKNYFIFFLIILNFIYFQAIQTAVFYQKNTYKTLGLIFSCFQTTGCLVTK